MKISIIITAYNVENYIDKAVRSALYQRCDEDELEVIVVNDQSTDSTRDIIAGITDKRLRIIDNPENVGAGMSRRIGVEASTGDYTLFLDGDDFLKSTFIHSLSTAAKLYDADIVSGGVTILRDEQVGYFDITCYGNRIIRDHAKVTQFYRERVVFMNNKLIRRHLHELVPYCTRRYIEDTPTIARQLYYANKVVYVNNPGYIYRMQPESLTHQASPFKGDIFRALCLVDLIEFYRGKGEEYESIFCPAQFYLEVSDMKKHATDAELVKYASEVREIYAYYNKLKERQHETETAKPRL